MEKFRLFKTLNRTNSIRHKCLINLLSVVTHEVSYSKIRRKILFIYMSKHVYGEQEETTVKTLSSHVLTRNLLIKDYPIVGLFLTVDKV